MTKHLHRLATGLQRSLLEAPWPLPDSVTVVRDAWASLYRWHESGEHVYRIRSDVQIPPIPADLVLATAPTARPAVCYVLDRDRWIVIARHGAEEPIRIRAPERVVAFRRPTLTYCAETETGGLASGLINLIDQPTPAHLHLYAGNVTRSDGTVHQLAASQISTEGLLLVRALPWYYSP